MLVVKPVAVILTFRSYVEMSGFTANQLVVLTSGGSSIVYHILTTVVHMIVSFLIILTDAAISWRWRKRRNMYWKVGDQNHTKKENDVIAKSKCDTGISVPSVSTIDRKNSFVQPTESMRATESLTVITVISCHGALKTPRLPWRHIQSRVNHTDSTDILAKLVELLRYGRGYDLHDQWLTRPLIWLPFMVPIEFMYKCDL